MEAKAELILISKAKELSKIIFEITQQSPKKFSFSLVARMQNESLDIVSALYSANDTIVKLKIVEDMDRTINFLQKKKISEGLTDYEERKLFELRVQREIKFNERVAKRIDYSFLAMASVKKLDWLTVMARDMGCITKKQGERVAEKIFEVRKILTGYIQSDRKRYGY